MKNYITYPNFIIRTPRKSFSTLKDLFDCNIEASFCKTDIQDAIYLASPELFEKLMKFSSLENKEQEKVKKSFIKYISRMATRCIPFGLFAGCSIGKIEEKTNLIVSQKIIRHTRLDVNYFLSLSQYLSDIPKIKFKLKYYPNDSLYIVGNEYRYISYHYSNDHLTHQVFYAKRTSYLDKILNIAKNGATIEDLSPYITNEYIQKDVAINYIHELIQARILISELAPTATGEDILNRMLSILEGIDVDNKYINALESIQDVMKQIDMQEESSLNKYKDIENHLKTIGASYNRKNIYHVDFNNEFKNCSIGLSIKKEIESTVTFLNKITVYKDNENLLKFQEAFYKRFEEREIPLPIAMDPEIGIGYPVENDNRNLSPLIDDLILPSKENTFQTINYGLIQSVLLKKLSEKNNSFVDIEINDDDFKDVKDNWDNLPDTISVSFEIIRNNENDVLIRLKSIGNSSAANNFARFAYTDEKIDEFVKEITNIEKLLNPDVILAEIAHWPHSKVSNVLFRPHLRDYEIVYLANSSMPKDKAIYSSDLMLSIKQGKLFLRSKRLNKEVIPRLTNAHNFHLSSTSIYRFLCDMQNQNKRASILFNVGFLKNELSYVPRIRYKNTILSPAIWNIKIDDIKHLMSIKEDEKLLYYTTIWREKNKISKYSSLSDMDDHELFIDWENTNSIRAFLSTVKNRTDFRLIEFLYDEKEAVIKDENGSGYLNECIVTLFKTRKNESC